MNSNLITISSILPQISTHGIDSVKIGKEKECNSKKFFIKHDYDTAKIETADNKAEIVPSKKNVNCQDSTQGPIIMLSQRKRNCLRWFPKKL